VTAIPPPLRLGIVGAGTMGGRATARLSAGELRDFVLAGVTDLDSARAEAVASANQGAAYPSLAALVEAERPDALYIATPDDAHRSPCLEAATLGVPFLVEKPLATTVEDAEAIASATADAGVVAEVNLSNRWNPPFVEAKRQADAGELGDFVTLFARLNNSIGSPTERLGWASRTTSAWFLLSHCLDLAYWLHGRRAVSVYASGVRGLLEERGIDTYDSIHAIVRYEGGADGSYESVWVLPEGMPAPVEFTFRYVGSRGAATIDTHEQAIRVASEERTVFPGTLNWPPNASPRSPRPSEASSPRRCLCGTVSRTRASSSRSTAASRAVPSSQCETPVTDPRHPPWCILASSLRLVALRTASNLRDFRGESGKASDPCSNRYRRMLVGLLSRMHDRHTSLHRPHRHRESRRQC
jgi:predicted dehydrogenase